MAIKLKLLAQKVILVTGATSGNGLAIVERAVKTGAAVVTVAGSQAKHTLYAGEAGLLSSLFSRVVPRLADLAIASRHDRAAEA